MLLNDEHERPAPPLDWHWSRLRCSFEFALCGVFAKLAFRHAQFYETVCRYERLFFQGVERKFLSGGHQTGCHARLVQRAPAKRKDQKQIQTNAQGERKRKM